MSNHPALLKSYMPGNTALSASATLSPVEQQVVFLSVSYENNCHYCMAAHSTVGQMMKIPKSVIDALRDGTIIPDAKLEALSQYAKATTVKSWRVSDEDLQNFLDAGYNQDQVLEVITIVGLKVMTNYVNALAKTPVDAAFARNTWEPRS